MASKHTSPIPIPPGDYTVKITRVNEFGHAVLTITDEGPQKGMVIFCPVKTIPAFDIRVHVETHKSRIKREPTILTRNV